MADHTGWSPGTAISSLGDMSSPAEVISPPPKVARVVAAVVPADRAGGGSSSSFGPVVAGTPAEVQAGNRAGELDAILAESDDELRVDEGDSPVMGQHAALVAQLRFAEQMLEAERARARSLEDNAARAAAEADEARSQTLAEELAQVIDQGEAEQARQEAATAIAAANSWAHRAMSSEALAAAAARPALRQA